MPNPDWTPYIIGRPFHVCEGCMRDLAPYEGQYCDECERVKRNSGQYPQDPDKISSNTPEGTPAQTP